MPNVIKIESSNYPRLLKAINKDAPKQLYYKGNYNESIFENCLAVVGSRKMTSYGRQITEKLVSEIASRGITIVSGFMYGVDATAHKATLEVGGKTIAVMPCGIEIIHPAYQKDLYQQILENDGLIISEYEGDFLPTLWSYPQRNRIVAGLSKAVLVVEAGEKSGSLITANFAKKYKRKVFVVPVPLTSSLSTGICQLIKQGAEVITGAGDIIRFYKPKEIDFDNNLRKDSKSDYHNHKNNSDLSEMEKIIIEELKKEPMKVDDICRTLKIPISRVGITLSLMQIKGLVFEEKGKFYAK